MAEQPEKNLSVGRNIKIGFFHLGSGMADVMMTGVWNRIMISDLGFAATPVSLLASLRYFLAPLGVWAGRMSDRTTIGGYRRLFWIWAGRALMVLSAIMLGLTTASLARGADASIGVWLLLAAALFIFSLGNALSGSTFLALVYDRSAPHQRGRAVGIVWTFLLVGFTVGGIVFGIMLPSDNGAAMIAYGGDTFSAFLPYADLLTSGLSFTPETLQNLFIVGGLIMGSLWVISLLGEERRVRGELADETGDDDVRETSLRQDLGLVWQSRPMRYFAFYLGFSMMFAFSQDAILEPFAGDVFDMSARVTTRFAAYWGSMSIIATLGFLFLSRKIKFLTNTNMSYIGVSVLIATFALFAISALFEVRSLVTIGLITLGIGLGIWNVGTLGLMMDMSPLQRAGTFLGFWTLVVTLSRGMGVSGGGIVRDIVLQLTGSLTLSYGLAFVLGMGGLMLSIWCLYQARIKTYKASVDELPQAEAATVLAGAMD